MNILKYIGKTKVEVFITKNRKFRASIKEPNKPRYEVTIGGKEWENGKGKKYSDRIYKKIEELTDNVIKEKEHTVPIGYLIGEK